MTTTAKRRPTVGDTVRLLIDLQPYKAGDIVLIMVDDISFTPYYCKFADNSFHWLIERFVELVEPVAPRRDPCVFGKAQVGVEPIQVLVSVDVYAHLRQALREGRKVRIKSFQNHWVVHPLWDIDTEFFHPVAHYEIEPEQAPVDPLADVKAALKAGKRVRCVQIDGTMGHWRTGVLGWHFHLPREHYEIEPDPIPEPKFEWVLGDKYLTRGGETAVLVQFDPGTRLPNRLVPLGTVMDHWVTEDGKNFPDQTTPHVDDIVKHLKDKS